MHAGKLVFAQVMEFAPWHTFRRLAAKYRADFNVRTFSSLDQFLSMAFAQITFRESLRDIEACMEAHATKAYHLGLRGNFTRSNLADANERCDWRLHCEFAQALIRIARRLYVTEPFGLELDSTVYALDSTTIDLCLTMFPWAPFRSTKAAIKLHTLLNLRGNIPSFIHISDGKWHDVNVLASAEPPVTIENPRQVSAYDYPPLYGCASPLFSRASLFRDADAAHLFVSGTASIVGHRSVHPGDPVAQTHETLVNIAIVVAEANRLAGRAQIARHGLPVESVRYLRADLCREDLLVEIEADAPVANSANGL